MEIYLKSGNGFFVPSIVADHLLGIASHDQLKVLLYVLAHPDTALTPEAIASACKVRPENTEEALAFWQDANVLTVSRNVPSVTLTDAVQPAAQPVQTVPAELPPARPEPKPRRSKKPPQADSSQFNLTSGEIAERISGNPSIRDMFQGIEMFAGALKPAQMNSCIYMNEMLGLSPAVILLLCHYCHSINKFHPNYWETIAQDWSDRGINTEPLAAEEIERREAAQTFVGKLRGAFGLKPGQDPTEKQQEYFSKWCAMQFPVELVDYACQRCRDSKGNEISFPYIDSVLADWQKKGITTVEAAKLEGAQFAAARKAGRQDAPSVPFDTKKQPADVRIDGEPSLDLSEIDSIFNQF